ncbi:hypothetical protein B0H16DRAFT_1465495 [Mycena metata]|uniref:Uncharacterized protein n=1 Tax=Mycena metata TaxID=1033252 RepID=A0AAD7IB85_9AGAR|nr:hypothetical protein B0H16DRAFT_1465495 [Mycena metata]
MRFTAPLALLVASAGLVRALDNFLLYNPPPQVNLTQFITAFESVCTIWPVAIENGQTLLGALAEGPRFNLDPPNSVRVTCTWLEGTTLFQYAADIAGELGATPFS